MQPSKLQLLIAMLTVLLGLLPGIMAAKKIKSAADYNVGGRKANQFLVAGTIIGTLVGGAATVGTAQIAFITGIAAWWFTLGSGIALIIMAFFYAKTLRNSGLTTISELLGQKYNPYASMLGSLSASCGIFFSIVASSLTAIHLIANIFNTSLLTSASIIIIITSGIIFFGGISGSGKTGLFKLGAILLTILYGGLCAYHDMGYFSGMQQTFTYSPWFNLFSHGTQQSLVNILSMIIGVISTQSYAQAIFSAQDSQAAFRGCILAALIVIPLGLPSVMIGMFMSIHHPNINSIEALPLFLIMYLPDCLGGIGIGALLLSSFGSISGLALGVSTMFSNDVCKKLWHDISPQKLLLTNRLSVLAVIILATIFTYFNLDSEVLKWNFLSMALRGCGIFLPLSFAIFCVRPIHPYTGVLSILAGIIISCFWDSCFGQYINSIFPSLIIGLVILLYGICFNDN
ncbi:MAG: sodium:solute symporter family protein [Phascolarctobacterium sp.]|nr:sodium:solute symporter family protein [Phascolarctobacterium sp.]